MPAGINTSAERSRTPGWRPTSPTAGVPGRNQRDRGHTPSRGRLFDDVVGVPGAGPIAAAGGAGRARPASAGAASSRSSTAARRAELLDGLALICPGLEPRVGVSRAEATPDRPGLLPPPPDALPDPAGRPGPVHRQPGAAGVHRRRPAEPPDRPPPACSPRSIFIDRAVRRSPGRVRSPALLMLAGRDRIVDNERTRRYFDRIAEPREDDHRVSRGPPHARIRARPGPLRRRPDRLDRVRRPTRPRRVGA